MVDNLDKLFKCQQSFIIRWKSANKLATTEGVTKNTWRICFGKKGLDKRLHKYRLPLYSLKLASDNCLTILIVLLDLDLCLDKQKIPNLLS